jgi:hypothetical protein
MSHIKYTKMGKKLVNLKRNLRILSTQRKIFLSRRLLHF